MTQTIKKYLKKCWPLCLSALIGCTHQGWDLTVPLKRSVYGNPSSYTIAGHEYHVLRTARDYDRTGIASWYGRKFHGRLTATREVYNMYHMTAASTELPLPTYVSVTNLENGRKIVVKVNDRGPFLHHRLLDLSYAAAKRLGFAKKGTAFVRVTALGYRTQSKKPHHPRLFIQVGAFVNQDLAHQVQKHLHPWTPFPVTITRTHRKPHYYQVRIGPIPNVQVFDALTQRLEHRGFHQFMAVVVP